MPQYSGIWTEQAVMQAVGAGNWPGNPGAPTIGTATAGDASASVTFTAPTSTGGSAITSYTVTSSPGGITGTGASSPITVSGLTNGTAYTFTVTATNATGTGPASAASNSVTPEAPVYIEDVYSTYLYTGNGSTQTITNGIDLSTYGGLVWNKVRGATGNTSYHYWVDTARGRAYGIGSNSTDAQYTSTAGNDLASFTTTGYTLGPKEVWNASNFNGADIVSWTFRKQPKFFDVVTYTGDSTNRTIAHNLGSVPGCIIVKDLLGGSWNVYHRSLANTQALELNSSSAVGSAPTYWNSTTPTSTVFSLGTDSQVNYTGHDYVAYLFAHNAGGFGLTGTDNVISCGSYVVSGGSATINLGYEPQFVLTKASSASGNWLLLDNMRQFDTGGATFLVANSTAAETGYSVSRKLTNTGFTLSGASDGTYIYVAIRRGPMKVPTTGTSVFDVDAFTGNGATDRLIDSGFVDDFFFFKNRALVNDWFSFDRLRGNGNYLAFDTTGSESGVGQDWVRFSQTQTGIVTGQAAYGDINTNGVSNVAYHFKRAPSFFDEVCYTGTGSTPQNINHNLGVAPELMIVKVRSVSGDDWVVYCSKVTDANIVNLRLNKTQAIDYNGDMWDATTPTATTFRVGQSVLSNYGGQKLVAYLFATCAGVSKVGSYTGTGATQTINCGFSAGARWVMIKRTDSTGDWYVWDTARGITSGNDPYLLLNSTAAEVTGTNYVDTTSVGFQVTAAAPAGLNASGGTYIFLAIA